uniref:Homeobox domain-containing protein n=1 Tax=Electrophorus electricus TaxID=8005 RepID=A0AAY5EB19_ELEEL
MDLSTSAERHSEKTDKENQGDSCLTSDSENEEFYTSVIVTDEESQSSSLKEEPGSPAKQSSHVDTSGEKEQKRPNARRFRDMRRSRTIIQADQLDVLYGCYFKDPNPGKHEFEQISEWVHLPKKVVQIWFQNMRARERKGEQTRPMRRLQHSTPRRPRTHLNCLQLSILQSCYETCAHPNALECEAVGTELGLPLKVVQIWFQNTRAKEKRWRLQQEKLVSLFHFCKLTGSSNKCSS